MISINDESLHIITPTLGQRGTLAECVTAVRKLRESARKQVEHIVVAPASRVSEISRRFTDVHVVAEPDDNRGVFAAVDAGFRDIRQRMLSRFWWTYINDDDLLFPGLVSAWERHSNDADVIYGDVMFIDQDGSRLGIATTERNPVRLLQLFKAGLIPMTQQGTLLKEEVYSAVGGFDLTLKLSADVDLLLKLLMRGTRFRYVPTLVGGYRRNPEQLSSDRALAQKERDRLFERYGINNTGLSARATRFCYWCRNAPRVLERIVRTGRLRTEDMFFGSKAG